MGNDPNSNEDEMLEQKALKNSESSRRREGENEEGGVHQVTDARKMSEMRKSL
jgi:hypothetical protein